MTTHDGPEEWPALERSSDTPMYNTKAVVQQTGVSAPTLRAWERRYALIAPARADNAYRLYSERDIVLIRWLKSRIDEGMSISHAVSLFRHLQQERQAQRIASRGEPPIGGLADLHLAMTPPDSSSVHYPLERVPETPLLVQGRHTVRKLYSSGSDTFQETHSIAHVYLVRDRLIEAFQCLDEEAANGIMGPLFTVYPVEQVCTDLIVPTLWHIGTLWAQGRLTISVEHFASNYFRTLLTNLYRITPTEREGPLILVCCAPGESHELAALMLALFLRRQNMRVAYLGQSIETASLLHTIRRLSPAMLCVSLTMPAYLSSFITLARLVQQLPAPHPLFIFGGQVFIHYANIIPQIHGTYLNGNLWETASRLCKMVAENESENASFNSRRI